MTVDLTGKTISMGGVGAVPPKVSKVSGIPAGEKPANWDDGVIGTYEPEGIAGKYEPTEPPKVLQNFMGLLDEIEKQHNPKLYTTPIRLSNFTSFVLYTMEGREDTEVDRVKCDLICCIEEEMYWENPYKISVQSPHVILSLDTGSIDEMREILDRYLPKWRKEGKEGTETK